VPSGARVEDAQRVPQSLRLLSIARRENPPRPILVAGADSAMRASVLHELTHTLPEGTRFEEAGAFWEVLARSPECRMVVFSGDLEDGSAESFMQTLAQRDPRLPVVSLKAQALPGT
jgi:DNA-binding NtrC family response regulator